MPNIEFINLKPLSEITNEDAEKLQYTLVNVVGLDGLIRQNSIDLVKEVVSNYHQIDCLFMLPSSFADLVRELGYAIDWNNYKVSKLVDLGWVKLT
jgi:putative N-acetylmannosamine-6-phosphate epimerase